jgi:hypothetical protein
MKDKTTTTISFGGSDKKILILHFASLRIKKKDC